MNTVITVASDKREILMKIMMESSDRILSRNSNSYNIIGYSFKLDTIGKLVGCLAS